LNFAVSGMLWNRSLVMKDMETGSLWSHLLGLCMRGPLEGAELALLPSMITDWKTWLSRHPQTTALNLSRTSTNYLSEFYKDPSKFGVAMAEGGEARAWSFADLIKQPVVNDAFAGKKIVVLFQKSSSTALIFERTLGGRTLTFGWVDGKLQDEQTHTLWDIASGVAISGELMGQALQPALGIVSYAKAWRVFHPNSTYWNANG